MTIFLDTFYLIGLLNRRDQNHARCVSFARTYRGLAVTTGYVLVELADALSSPATRGQTAAFIAQLNKLTARKPIRNGLSPIAFHLSSWMKAACTKPLPATIISARQGSTFF